MARSSFKTEKGTELPLLNLKGKEYLQVSHRLVWFREKYSDGLIKTQLVEKGGEGSTEFALFRAEIYVNSDKGLMLVATAHKRETRSDFPDFIEKCETGAIGRALALMGIGTQFAADELDEKERLADAPVTNITKPTAQLSQVTAKASGDDASATTTTETEEAPARKPSQFRARLKRTNVGG